MSKTHYIIFNETTNQLQYEGTSEAMVDIYKSYCTVTAIEPDEVAAAQPNQSRGFWADLFSFSLISMIVGG